MHAAHRGAKHHTDVIPVFIGNLQLGIIDGELGSDEREERGAVEVAQAFGAKVGFGLEVADLARMVAAVLGSIEEGDGFDARDTGGAIAPKLFFADAVRGDDPNPRNNNTLTCQRTPPGLDWTIRRLLLVRGAGRFA